MTKIDFLIARDKCRAAEGNKRDIELVKAFIGKGYSSGMISSCQIIHSQLKKEGIFSIQMLKLIKVSSRLNSMEQRAGRIEREYQIPSLKRFVFPEKCYYKRLSYDYLFRKVIVYFEGLEKFFNQVEVKCLVLSQGGQINTRVLYAIARKRGIPVIYTHDYLFPGKMILFSDEMQNQFRFKNISWDEMTSQQKKEIEKHVKEFKEKRNLATYSLVKTKKEKIIRSLIGLQEYIENKQFKELKDAFAEKLNLIYNNLFKFSLTSSYQNNIKDEKFIYFPLHVIDDSAITIRNTQFYDQCALISLIARSLPFGYKLYIKGHPDFIGSLLNSSEIKDFKKEKNVTILNSKINSHEIIKKAKAVIVISSTVSLEALYYFKPVIIVGNWGLLKGKGITTDIYDLFKLDEAIKSALEKKIDPNKIKAFLFSFRESMFDGALAENRMDYDKVTDSFIKRYKEIKS